MPDLAAAQEPVVNDPQASPAHSPPSETLTNETSPPHSEPAAQFLEQLNDDLQILRQSPLPEPAEPPIPGPGGKTETCRKRPDTPLALAGKAPPPAPANTVLPEHPVRGLWFPVAAILAVGLLISILAVGWLFVRVSTLHDQLSNAERTAAARASALEQQKQETAATTARANALQKQLSDAEQKAAARASALEQQKQETATATAKADALQKQLLDLQPKVPKELAKQDTAKPNADPKFGKQDATKMEMKSLQGHWRESHSLSKGFTLTVQGFSLVMIFEDDQVKVGRVFNAADIKDLDSWKYTIDPTNSPKTIDLTMTKNGKSRTRLGIYEFKGDTLMVSWGKVDSKERPKAFDDRIVSIDFYVK